jgi:hypothetical protein
MPKKRKVQQDPSGPLEGQLEVETNSIITSKKSKTTPSHQIIREIPKQAERSLPLDHLHDPKALAVKFVSSYVTF